jgi:hypothetical protein
MLTDTDLSKAKQRINRIQIGIVAAVVLGLGIFVAIGSGVLSSMHTVGYAMEQTWTLHNKIEDAAYKASLFRNTGTEYAYNRAVASASDAALQLDSLTALANTAGYPAGLRNLCKRVAEWHKGLTGELKAAAKNGRTFRTEPSDQKVYRTVSEQMIDSYMSYTNALMMRQSHKGRAMVAWFGGGLILAAFGAACWLILWTRSSLRSMSVAYQGMISNLQPAAGMVSDADTVAIHAGDTAGDIPMPEPLSGLRLSDRPAA